MGMPNTIKRETFTRNNSPTNCIFFTCKWCGNQKNRLYTYNQQGLFCDLGCFLSYNDITRRDFDWIEYA